MKDRDRPGRHRRLARYCMRGGALGSTCSCHNRRNYSPRRSDDLLELRRRRTSYNVCSSPVLQSDMFDMFVLHDTECYHMDIASNGN